MITNQNMPQKDQNSENLKELPGVDENKAKIKTIPETRYTIRTRYRKKFFIN